MKLTGRQTNLFEFVKHQHGSQVRKYKEEPYYNHLYRVAETVEKFEKGTVEIALCHDLLEDTNCTKQLLYDTLLNECNYSPAESKKICDGVIALTDVYTKEAYPRMNRKERKLKEHERLSAIHPIFQSVKYADIIDNTTSIVEFAPDFAPKYLDEMVDLIGNIRKGNARLLILCCHSVQEGLNAINTKRNLR